MKLQGIILDVDGTLVLSNDEHAHAWVAAFHEYGYDVSFEQVRPLLGMGGDKLMPELVPGLNDEEGDGKEITSRRKEIFLERYAPHLKPTRGARELLQHLRNQGLRLAIASSASEEELGALLKAAQVEDSIDDATTSSDAEESKPAPDIVEVALRKLELQSDQVVMLGDTPYDIRSAGACTVNPPANGECGVGVIAVRCGGFLDQELAGALAIYDDPADLLAHLAESPLAQ